MRAPKDLSTRCIPALAIAIAVFSTNCLAGPASGLIDLRRIGAVVGNPDDCIRELERIRDIINPEWLFITPTGVPDTEQQAEELRLFAKEVMPHFRSEESIEIS